MNADLLQEWRSRLVIALCIIGFALLPNSASAENGCPAGYEPWRIPVESQSDCMAIPDYNQPSTDAPRSQRPDPPTWHNYAGVVVWADSGAGDQFVTIERFLIVDEEIDLDLAKAEALKKCRGNPGWINCKVASWTINGTIAVGRDSRGVLRLRNANDPGDARARLLERCATDGLVCKIVGMVDSRPRYF